MSAPTSKNPASSVMCFSPTPMTIFATEEDAHRAIREHFAAQSVEADTRGILIGFIHPSSRIPAYTAGSVIKDGDHQLLDTLLKKNKSYGLPDTLYSAELPLKDVPDARRVLSNYSAACGYGLREKVITPRRVRYDQFLVTLKYMIGTDDSPAPKPREVEKWIHY